MFWQIVFFYILKWFFLILLGGLQEASGILPPEIGLAQWGPGAAALVTVAIFRKDQIKITFFSKDTPVSRYLLAILVPTGVGFIAYLLRVVFQLEASPAPQIFDMLLLVLIWTPLGALGEEIGWRGYLNKKLDTKMRGLSSAILVGLLWTPMHFFAFASAGAVTMLSLTIWLISLSVVMYGLLKDTGFSVLLATLFHMSINFINLLILDVYMSQPFWIINAGLWVIVAVVFVLRDKEWYLGAK